MFDPKKLQQIADDLGEPRKQIVNQALELLSFYMGRTGEMFAEIERLKKQVNDTTQQLAQVIGERDDALNERDMVAKARDNITRSWYRRGDERDALKATVARLKKMAASWRGKAIDDVTPLIFAIEKAPQQNLSDHDKELLTRFTNYLNERCDLHVQNMVRPFLEREKDSE